MPSARGEYKQARQLRLAYLLPRFLFGDTPALEYLLSESLSFAKSLDVQRDPVQGAL